MSKKKFAVIGHPIGHTMSPFIHKRLFQMVGINGEYTVLDIAPEELSVKMHELDRLNGYNVTIPNKSNIIPFMQKLNKRAELYGSVNTVRNGEYREGFTTDPDGFLKALEASDIKLAGKVLILGCGGVARTFVGEAALAGCDITVAIRPEDETMLLNLVSDIESKIPETKIKSCLLSEIEGEYQLLVNATPLGMFPKLDTMAVSEKVIAKCENVFDAVYNPLETKLVKIAKANGSKAVGGMAMLVWQAVSSELIWNGDLSFDPQEIEKLILDCSKELSNR